MNKVGIGVLMFVLAGLMAVTALADGATELMTANVPFGFVVGHTEFPAGEYSISGSTLPNCIWIRGNGKVANNLTMSSENRGSVDKSVLVFKRYGNTYFLVQVVDAGRGYSKQLTQSAREREAMIAAGKSNDKMAVVRIPASR